MTTFDRRTLLLAGTGATALVLTACTTPSAPANSPGPTTSAPATTEPVPAEIAPAASSIKRSDWAADQFSRGSHSVALVGSTAEHRDALAETVADRVFFAGEATWSDAPGTVTGARLSGARVATDVRARAGEGDSVVVVGAGLAGAEAASRLAAAGFEVTVVEARDRVGGRVHSVTEEPWPVPVELGAWLLQEATDAQLLTDLRLEGVGSALLGSVEYLSPDGATAGAEAAEPAASALDAAAVWAAGRAADTDLATALVDSGEASAVAGVADLEGAALLSHRLDELAVTNGVDASELSSWYGLVGATGLDGRRAITGDFSAYITAALSGAQVYLSTTVTTIAYDENGVSLRLGTGESISADRVVVTVPLGVLKDEAIEFAPLLPFAHRTAIDALGVGTVDSIWLRFDEPFWTTDATVWHVVGTDDDLTVWFNLEPITGDPTLVALVGGEAAARVAALSDEEVRAAAQAALAPFLPTD